jgi:hypothetical protein
MNEQQYLALNKLVNETGLCEVLSGLELCCTDRHILIDLDLMEGDSSAYKRLEKKIHSCAEIASDLNL